jgi:SH3 domain protein
MVLPQVRLVFFCLFFSTSGASAYAAPDKKPSPPALPNDTASAATIAEAELASLRSENQKMIAELNQARTDYQQLKQMSAQAIYLNQTNQKMREELELQKIEVEKLTQQNRQLSQDNRVEGIIQGTIAVLVGALLAIFIPRATQRKPFSTWH